MERTGHRILFSVKGVPGFIEIKRIGWVNFDYVCNIGGTQLPELTEKINIDTQQRELYDVKIAGHRSGSDGYSEDMITWYLVESTRISDEQTNTVYRLKLYHLMPLIYVFRRFRDFVSLNDDVRENFRGHQLFNSLPEFPQKKLKLGLASFSIFILIFSSVTDHTDPAFLTQRESQLQVGSRSMTRYSSLIGLSISTPPDSTCSRINISESIHWFS